MSWLLSQMSNYETPCFQGEKLCNLAPGRMFRDTNKSRKCTKKKPELKPRGCFVQRGKVKLCSGIVSWSVDPEASLPPHPLEDQGWSVHWQVAGGALRAQTQSLILKFKNAWPFFLTGQGRSLPFPDYPAISCPKDWPLLFSKISEQPLVNNYMSIFPYLSHQTKSNKIDKLCLHKA